MQRIRVFLPANEPILYKVSYQIVMTYLPYLHSDGKPLKMS